jgi:hypothetical protein
MNGVCNAAVSARFAAKKMPPGVKGAPLIG